MTDLHAQLFAEPLWESLRQETTLTSCQMEVVRLMCMGLSTKEITRQLGIAPKTTESHKRTAREKLDCANYEAVISRMLMAAFEKCREGQHGLYEE